ncbi:MAG: helix-hairpin-helix domain-containing protein [Bacteroidia bacterium]
MSAKENFTFTNSQKKGIFAFVFILLIAIFITSGIKFFESTGAELSNLKEPNFTEPVYTKTNSTRLDINLADSSQLASLNGIGPVLARRIINYRKFRKGFNSVGELRRVYGLSEETFTSIEPYLFVSPITAPSFSPSIANSRPKASFSTETEIPLVLDINLASAEDFQKLPGIGSVLSKRIINYRNSIKGFESVDELSSVYNLSSEVIDQNRDYLIVNARTLAEIRNIQLPDQQESRSLFALIQTKEEPREEAVANPEVFDGKGRSRGSSDSEEKEEKEFPSTPLTLTNLIININTADSATLTQINGIGKVFARRIVSYRNKIGFYSSTNDLIEIYGIEASDLDKIKEYTTVGDISSYPKKDLNTISEKNLTSYPAIDQKLAKKIIAERKKLGRFDSWKEVEEIKPLEESTLDKLKTYFHL